jgi:hypothetical protein
MHGRLEVKNHRAPFSSKMLLPPNFLFHDLWTLLRVNSSIDLTFMLENFCMGKN